MALSISIWRILLASVVGFVIGWVWFMKPLFGDAWVKLHKFSKKEMKDGQDPRRIGLGYVGTLVTAIALAIALSAWGVTKPSEATIVALITSIGFVAAGNLNFVIWGREPQGAFLINTMYMTVQFVVMAMILVW